MQRGFNSTIKIKQKICSSCGKPCYWFSRKRCIDCARQEDSKDQPIEDEGESLTYLISDLDAICSLIVRMKDADAEGFGRCYTCSVRLPWKELQAGHYVSRKNMFLRFDFRNLRKQCANCNCNKHGNLAEYGKRLEKENPGITEILLEESRIVHKWGRDELRAMVVELNKQLTILKEKNKTP